LLRSWKALLLTCCVAACASEVVRHPTELSATPPQQQKRYVASQPASIMLDSGYSRTIGRETEFLEIGRIKQGAVLKPLNSSLTVEGAHMHEAYPVVENGHITGFYLPVEQAFSPLSRPTTLVIEERRP
jgi:hypothetical protein